MDLNLYFTIVCFIFGAVLGSFYNVVGYRLPRGESLISPSSHCTSCNHKLNVLDLFPIFSYVFLRGKCRYCGHKVSPFYLIFETLTGILFAIVYNIFGFSIDFWISIIMISILLIVIISDYQTMIIPDELLIFGIIFLLPCIYLKSGTVQFFYSILDGVICFAIMWLIKIIGDFLFKKESMGGGDIKLMFLFGLVLGIPMTLFSIFLGSLIGLPISLYILYKNKSHEIPFGPFLSTAAILIILFQIDFNMIAKIFNLY